MKFPSLNGILSYLLKDVELEELKVKHFEVTSENTLTTPKVMISNSGVNPVNDGEITRNGSTLKVKTLGNVINIGRSMYEDVSGEQHDHRNAGNNVVEPKGLANPGTSYSTKSSVTVTVAEENSIVIITGYAIYASDIRATLYAKVLESAVEKIAEQTISIVNTQCRAVTVFGIITGVSSGSHTYDLQTRASASGSSTLMMFSSGITAEVIKLV